MHDAYPAPQSTMSTQMMPKSHELNYRTLFCAELGRLTPRQNLISRQRALSFDGAGSDTLRQHHVHDGVLLGWTMHRQLGVVYMMTRRHCQCLCNIIPECLAEAGFAKSVIITPDTCFDYVHVAVSLHIRVIVISL